MMKFKVFEKPEVKKEEVYFRLEEDDFDNTVSLIAVDKNGDFVDQGVILILDERGVTFCSGVSRNIGISLDDSGYVLNKTD